MELKFDCHSYCNNNSLNISNFLHDFKCCKVLCVKNIFSANETYAYNIKYEGQNRRYWKRHTNKPFLLDLTILDEMYTCVFCNSLAFCESMCGACMFIGHLLSSMYNCLVVHVDFHNHPNAKGKNQKVLNKLN